MNDLVTLGQRLRHFRNAAGLTLDQLGERVGVAGSQLSLMENGRREPRVTLLSSLAEALLNYGHDRQGAAPVLPCWQRP